MLVPTAVLAALTLAIGLGAGPLYDLSDRAGGRPGRPEPLHRGGARTMRLQPSSSCSPPSGCCSGARRQLANIVTGVLVGTALVMLVPGLRGTEAAARHSADRHRPAARALPRRPDPLEHRADPRDHRPAVAHPHRHRRRRAAGLLDELDGDHQPAEHSRRDDAGRHDARSGGALRARAAPRGCRGGARETFGGSPTCRPAPRSPRRRGTHRDRDRLCGARAGRRAVRWPCHRRTVPLGSRSSASTA